MRRVIYVRILPNHLAHFRRNLFTFLAPRGCAFEDGDAFVHDCFEVFGFGVEGGDVLGWHFGWSEEV